MASFKGDDFANSIDGTVLDDEILGLAGDDTLNGLAGSDTIYGGDDNDTITGGDDDDFLFGDDGDDELRGGAGQDEIYGGAGDDTITQINDGDANLIDGGADIDTLDLGGSTAGWTIDLTDGAGSSGGSSLVISDIERVNGTDYDDTMRGGASVSTSYSLYGGTGNDTLFFSVGRDLLFGGTGDDVYIIDDTADVSTNDFLFGGSGHDTVMLRGQADGDTFDMYGVDVSSIDQITFDSVGTGRDITLRLNGSEFTSTGSEYATNLVVDGNNAVGSTEIIQIDMSTDTELDLSGWTFVGWGAQGEKVVINGDADAETITGTIQDDDIDMGDGDDTLFLTAGDDSYDGGLGIDTLDFLSETVDVTIDLTAGTGSSSLGTLQVDGFERVTAGDGDDTMRGGASVSTSYSLYGGTGNDTLFFSVGRDLLFGGTGDDVYIIDDTADVSTNDFLFGGSGHDTVMLRGQADGDTFDMYGVDVSSIDQITFDSVGTGRDITLRLNGSEFTSTGSEYATNLVVDGNNAVGSTEIIQIDMSTDTELDLSGWTFVGWGAQGEKVVINGDADAETITGTIQDDVIEGGDGDDTLFLTAGDDSYDGGLGIDTLDFLSETVDVTIDLTAGTGSSSLGTLQVDGFERVTAGDGDDTMRGGASVSTSYSLYGGTGNDTLFFSAGRDLLFGGTGDDVYIIDDTADVSTNDFLFGGSGHDTVMLRGQADGDTFDMYGVDVSSIDQITFDSVGTGRDITLRLNGSEFTSTGSEYATNLVVDGNNAVGSTEIIQIDMSTDTELDLSGWTFVGWGAQGEKVVINGDADAETITGTIQDDVIEGGAGADILDGGAEGAAGDTLSYEGSTSGVLINLNTGVASGGHATGDTITDFENVIGSAYDDQLRGDGGANSLTGLAGDDVLVGGISADALYGGADDDTLDGGAGDDIIDGGAGEDTVDYSGATGGVTLTLNGAVAAVASGFGADSVVNIEHILGSDHADKFTGDANDNTIEGGLGDDVLDGGAGANDTASYASASSGVGVNLGVAGGQNTGVTGFDQITGFENLLGSDFGDFLVGNSVDNTLWGEGGADTLAGHGGEDVLFGDAGADSLYGGSNSDELYGGIGNDRLDGDAGSDTLWGEAGNDTLYGGTSSDTLYGGNDADQLFGGSSADELFGDSGDDTLEGGASGDSLYGGAGVDTASYAGAGAGVSVSLVAGGTGVSDDATGDVFDSIENLAGSAHDDTLAGDANGNLLTGGGGNDTLLGSGGADTLSGEAGDDLLIGGTGADSMAGGADGPNGDTLSYAGSTAGVTVSLASGTASGGDAAGDSFTGIENLIGSAETDTLTGDGGANTLDGSAGDDTIIGAGGDDTLLGGLGDDLFLSGAGADFMNGGTGLRDVADYSGSASAVDVGVDVAATNLGGDALGDTLLGVEDLIGSDFDDELTGNTASNILTGGDGSDTINASSNNDTVYGGEGDDHIIGGRGADMIYGGNNGAAGDTISYSNSELRVTVDLDTGGGTGLGTGSGHSSGDILDGIENIFGSLYNDLLTGDAGANSINGFSGDDTIYGEGGVDQLIGGGGSDTLYGGAAADTLEGGAGDDILVGGSGADTLIGGGNGTNGDTASYEGSASGVTVNLFAGTASGGDAAGDTFSGIENLLGSSQNDTLTGTSIGNTIDGGAGNDTLYGGVGAGDDVLLGGSGNDTFGSDQGADAIDGGSGTEDVVDYSASNAAITLTLGAGATNTGGHAAGDIVTTVENVIGSDHDDMITGDNVRNELYGGTGDDTLDGGANTDELYGGAGSDLLIGGTGADTLDGGADGATGDTVSYVTSALHVTVNLGAGTATGSGHSSGDTLIDIENVIGSTYNDTITGDGQDNRLDGGTGNDSLTGAGGADTFAFTEAAFGQDTVTDFADGVDMLDFTAQGWDETDFTITQVGLDTLLTLNADNAQTLTLLNVTATDITGADFL